MVLKQLSFLFLFVGGLLACNSNKSEKIPNFWEGSLKLSADVNLPIRFELKFSNGDSSFTLINGPERLVYPIKNGNNDDFYVRLEPYNSELNFSISQNGIKGIWTNLAKGPDYKIEFWASPFLEKIAPKKELEKLKYQIQFGKGEDAYPAVLLLNKGNSELSGTIKTETGDYRYLWGKQQGDSMWLACFDGAHAFLFNANQKGDSLINGVFYSGNHYQDIWNAKLNENCELTDPTKLTKAITDSNFRFSLIGQSGSPIDQNNPSFNGKVTCVQIMGTYCPNCKDETEFLKELRTKYPENELQIIAAAFEYEKDTAKAMARIKQYSNSMEMNYPIYYGGSTDKKKVTEVFPDLDKVISYPTLIILDKSGKVQQVHTGFNGPATDEYLNFKKNTLELIDSLIII